MIRQETTPLNKDRRISFGVIVDMEEIMMYYKKTVTNLFIMQLMMDL